MTDASSPAQDRHAGFRVIRDVAPYLWPEGEPNIRIRVVLALAALTCTKLIAVVTPLFYKSAVDALAEDGGFMSVPNIYMEKIAVGPDLPDGVVDLDAEPADNLKALAKAS